MKYIIVVDKQPKSNPSTEKREYPIDIEELRAKGNVHDSLIIKLGQVHVMRRLSLSKYHVLSVLAEPIKEPLPDVNIELFDGDNYIYLVDMIGNVFYAQYLNKNDFNDVFATRTEMQGAIEVSSREIEISVDKKLTDYSTTEETKALIQLEADQIKEEVSRDYATKEGLEQERSERIQKANEISEKVEKKVDGDTITGAYLMLLINGDTSEAKLKADKISIEGKKAKFKTNTKTDYTYSKADLDKIRKYIMNEKTLTQAEINLYDINNDGVITATDYTMISNRIGTNGGSFSLQGSFEINPDSASENVIIRDSSGEKITSVGLYGMRTRYFGALQANIKNLFGKSIFISEDGINYIPAQMSADIENGEIVMDLVSRNASNSTSIKSSGIETPKLTQTSLKSKKKNIKKLKANATDLIKNSDICLYNLKGEKAKSKKHIGLVIGDGYNCPNEVISEDGQGVEQYSMTSLAWKAIQEQQEIIENLKQRIEELEAK